MCSYFKQRMESHDQQGGDLGDIIRASSRGCSTGGRTVPSSDLWRFPIVPTSNSGFGDPFSDLGHDPLLLLHELSTTTTQINCPDSSITAGLFDVCSDLGTRSSSGANSDIILDHKILWEEKSTRPCNIFSRFINQVSPNARRNDPLFSDVNIRPPPILVGGSEMMKMGSSSLQISSSPRAPEIKRRKNQAKKVVCIPAPPPAAGNSRPSGEVVPSDLWAWRKYGQKPIKGSPYPRGYYRCSSSKGCSARKQVERSRMDPNMLVITYTSEHNHPWPTQRNALAGSTRSQPSSRTDQSTTRSNSVQGTRTHVKEKEVASSCGGPVKDGKIPAVDRVFDDFLVNLCEFEDGEMEFVFSKEEDNNGNQVEQEKEEPQEMDLTKGTDEKVYRF